MSKRTTGKTASDSTTPAPRSRKAAAAATEAPKTVRTRRKVTAAPVPSQVPEVAAGPLVPSADEIATRAYFIALERGFPGDPVADWLQAERDLNVFRS
jgi:hypothetical protein